MLASLRVLMVVLPAAAIATGGCGGPSASGPQAPVSAAASAPAAPREPARRPRPSRIARRDLMPVLSGGLGPFWSRTEVKPALAGGRFRGWQIVAFRWQGTPLGDIDLDAVDLRPGDVVTSVNGRPIERPEQAQACWQALTVAGELRVSYLRGTEKREIVYPIDDDPPASKPP
jgi:hypothetical protein